MSITPRTPAEIRDTLLGYWSAEYAARGVTLLTAVGSDAYILAAAIGVVQALTDQQGQQIARDIFPLSASDEGVARFGDQYGIAQRPATPAALSAQVTGAATGTTYTIPAGTQLSWTDGLLYDVLDTSVTTDGSSHATISIVCSTTGAATTRDVGDVLTFMSAPSGLNPTAPVTAVGTVGEDAESYQDWAARITARLQERPASGNRSDWAAWVLSYTKTPIVDAYVYPLLEPPASNPGNGTANVLGCVTVVAVGPAQGDSTTNTRIVPADDVSLRTAGAPLLHVIDYIEGDRTANGALTTAGTQLRPVTMAYGDYTVEAINTQAQNVEAVLTVTAANAFSFPYASSPGVDSSSDATHVIVSGNYGPGGVVDLSGLSVLVYIGTTNYRGGYYRTTLGSGSYNGGTGLTTFLVDALPHAPVTPSFVYPATPCWDAIRAATFEYFDGLGPSDSVPPSRWPTQDAAGRSTLYRSALAGRYTQTDGVLAASISTPATDTTPSTWKTVLTLGSLLVHE